MKWKFCLSLEFIHKSLFFLLCFFPIAMNSNSRRWWKSKLKTINTLLTLFGRVFSPQLFTLSSMLLIKQICIYDFHQLHFVCVFIYLFRLFIHLFFLFEFELNKKTKKKLIATALLSSFSSIMYLNLKLLFYFRSKYLGICPQNIKFSYFKCISRIMIFIVHKWEKNQIK